MSRYRVMSHYIIKNYESNKNYESLAIFINLKNLINNFKIAYLKLKVNRLFRAFTTFVIYVTFV